jgi:bacillopeptidase F (M6 metalloprotease family)
LTEGLIQQKLVGNIFLYLIHTGANLRFGGISMGKGFIILNSFLAACVLFMFWVVTSASAGYPIWTEDFEGNWQDCWHVDAGTWEVGPPTSGPGNAHSGSNSAATNLSGLYGNYVDSRLIRHCPFIVPSADQDPGLRFWHWFSFYPNGDDFGEVQIRVVGEADWTTLAEIHNYGGEVWTRTFISLSDYAGQNVEIAFYFHSNNYYQDTGWYIDEVSLEEGPRVFTSPEDWESGLDDWYVESGSWEVGVPSDGPIGAHDGDNCVATRLNGLYSNWVESRLISPHFVVPSAEQDPGLRFWHWFSFYHNGDDYGEVQIRAVGEADWATLAEIHNYGGEVWTRTFISLSDYAGQNVEIAFYFHSNNYYQDTGWYIDEVSLEEGPRVFTSPEDWESGLDDWYVESGSWEVGVPSDGPSSAHDGDNCVATRLNGIYSNWVESRLISPPFFICPAVDNPVLRFWHWYSFYTNGDDLGSVQIRIVGDTDWTTLAEYINHGGGVWTRPYIPLSAYIGQTVQIAFSFHSNNYYQDSGWYIDEVELIGLTPKISSAPLSKYSPSVCSALISIDAQDPCGGELYYDWTLPENCHLIGTGSEVEIECPDVGSDPHEVNVSVESATSHVGTQNRTISIFTQVLYDFDTDDDIDGADLHDFSGSFIADQLERFAKEFGVVACQ